MSFTSEEMDGHIKSVWAAPGLETGHKLTHLEKKRDHPMLETLSLFILVHCHYFVLNLTGADA